MSRLKIALTWFLNLIFYIEFWNLNGLYSTSDDWKKVTVTYDILVNDDKASFMVKEIVPTTTTTQFVTLSGNFVFWFGFKNIS